VGLTALEQQCRKLDTQVEQLQNQTAVYKELLQVCCLDCGFQCMGLVDWYCGYGATTPCAPRP
jgi:hypothetical protein